MNSNDTFPTAQDWSNLIGAFLIMFFVQGARTVIGVMVKPMIQELAWSRSDISMAAFVNLAVFALSLTVVGKCYDTYGARRIIAISSILLGAAYIGITMVQTLWAFLLLYGVCAALGFGGTSIPLFGALIGKRFNRHKGLAISVALAGGCLGQYIIVPSATVLVQAYGWRLAFAFIGATALVVNLLLVSLLINEHPSTPVQPHHTSTDVGTRPRPPLSDLNLSAAMHTPSFWFYLTVMFICGGGDYLVLTHLIPMVTDHGLPAVTAGKMLGWAGFCSLLGVLLTGPITDRFGNRIVVIVTFLLRAVIFLLICRYHSLFAYYGFALAFGFTMLITAPITTTLIGKLYGFSHIGVITGIITTVHHFSGGLWAWYGGVIYDTTGSYQAVLLLSAASACIAVGCAAMIREAKHFPERSSDRQVSP